MKNPKSRMAGGWKSQCFGIIILATCLSASTAKSSTPEAEAQPIIPKTNSLTAVFSDLDKIRARISASVALMSNAVNSTHATQAARVTKLADQIFELATKDLGDEGKIFKQAEALVAKFKESVDQAHKGSSDSTLNPTVRAIYSQLVPPLEDESAKLIDAKSAVVNIRKELIRQAECLRQSADAIGFADHCDQLVLASQAFRQTLVEIGEFSSKLTLLIQSVGKSIGVPMT